MPKEEEIRRNFWGDPDIHGFFGEWVTIGGEEYQVVERRADGSIIARKGGGLFGEERVVERGLLGDWHVRKKGWFD